MIKRVIFISFYGKIEIEIESGLPQQTITISINTLNTLRITFLGSFEQKNFYCQKVISYLYHF